MILSPIARADDDVIVRGNLLPRGSRDDEAASSTIRGERLVAPGMTASELLRTETGVTVNESGGFGALSTVQIRGATSAQTPVYLAGIRLNDDLTGGADLSLVPLWLISRVEIYRGNAPLEAQPGGIGGAVFFDPIRPRFDSAHVAKPQVVAGVMSGSFGAEAGWAKTHLGNDRASAIFGIRHEYASNHYAFQDDHGTRFDASDDRESHRQNSDATSTDAWALSTLRPTRRVTIDILAHQLSREQGVPGLGLVQNRQARLHSSRELYGVRLAAPCGTLCTLHLSSSALLSRVIFDDPLLELGLGGSLASARGSRVDSVARIEWHAPRNVEWGAQVRAARDEVIAARDTSAADATRLSSAASISASYNKGAAMSVRALASIEGVSTENLGSPTPASLFPSGRISALIRHPWMETTLNIGSYARVPTLGELYGFSGSVRGNQALLPERGSTLDLTERFTPIRMGSGTRLEANAFVYARTASDLVAYRRSSLGYVVPYNVGSARIFGFEADAALTFLKTFDLRGSLSLKDSRDTTGRDGNTALPYQSPLNGSAQLAWHIPRISLLGINDGLFDVSYVISSSRYADPAGLVVIPTQGSLSAGIALRTAQRHVQLHIRATNILAEKRFDTVGFPLPLRAFYTSIEVAP